MEGRRWRWAVGAVRRSSRCMTREAITAEANGGARGQVITAVVQRQADDRQPPPSPLLAPKEERNRHGPKRSTTLTPRPPRVDGRPVPPLRLAWMNTPRANIRYGF